MPVSWINYYCNLGTLGLRMCALTYAAQVPTVLTHTYKRSTTQSLERIPDTLIPPKLSNWSSPLIIWVSLCRTLSVNYVKSRSRFAGIAGCQCGLVYASSVIYHRITFILNLENICVYPFLLLFLFCLTQ